MANWPTLTHIMTRVFRSDVYLLTPSSQSSSLSACLHDRLQHSRSAAGVRRPTAHGLQQIAIGGLELTRRG